MDIYEKINDLYDRRRKVELGGGDERIKKQHEKGKLTARERIEILIDEGTFVELNPFIEHRAHSLGFEGEAPGEGVVTGYGKIEGRPVYLFAQDFTVYGGALGEMHGRNAHVMDLRRRMASLLLGLMTLVGLGFRRASFHLMVMVKFFTEMRSIGVLFLKSLSYSVHVQVERFTPLQSQTLSSWLKRRAKCLLPDRKSLKP